MTPPSSSHDKKARPSGRKMPRPYYSLDVAVCLGCKRALGNSYVSGGHFLLNPTAITREYRYVVSAAWHQRCEARFKRQYPDHKAGCYGPWEEWMGVRSVGLR